MELRILFVLFFVFCFQSSSFSKTLNFSPLEKTIDDSTDYNFFSPNNDSINDFFTIPKIDNDGIRDSKISIFNRWGDLVFEEKPFLNKWDGKGNQLNVKDKELPEGVYLYRLEYNVLDKTTSIIGKIILKR